jgi:hypothetical protein
VFTAASFYPKLLRVEIIDKHHRSGLSVIVVTNCFWEILDQAKRAIAAPAGLSIPADHRASPYARTDNLQLASFRKTATLQ